MSVHSCTQKHCYHYCQYHPLMIDDISNLGLGHYGHKLFNYFLLTYFYTSLCESHSQIERTQRVSAILIFSLEQKTNKPCCVVPRSAVTTIIWRLLNTMNTHTPTKSPKQTLISTVRLKIQFSNLSHNASLVCANVSCNTRVKDRSTNKAN